jgi:hypothetical protein
MKSIPYLLIAFLLLFGCSKNKVAPAPVLEDYSLSAYLKQTGFDQTVSNIGQGAPDFFERGTVFEPKTDGNLTAILVKLPASALNMKVILWNATTKLPLKTITINYTFLNVDQEIAFPITPVPLKKNEKYCISTNILSDIYKRKRTNSGRATYPIAFKKLTIIGHYSESLSDLNLRKFPTVFEEQSYFGDLSFTFEQTIN